MFAADLHIHSKYARATSKDCVPECLDMWAGKKRSEFDRNWRSYTSDMEAGT